MRLLREVGVSEYNKMAIVRAYLDLKVERVIEKLMRRSLQPCPLDKPRGENESKLSRCTPRYDAVRCFVGLSPESRLVSSLRYYLGTF